MSQYEYKIVGIMSKKHRYICIINMMQNILEKKTIRSKYDQWIRNVEGKYVQIIWKCICKIFGSVYEK